jgi:probable phosphoglycerate mutase
MFNKGENKMLYIMRHGKTDWNAQRRLQGRTDIPLNAEGRQMAEAARKAYQQIPFDICYCSPLRRARETAEIVLRGRQIPIISDERLVEMCFGEYEGKADCMHCPDSPISVLFDAPEKYNTPVAGAESLTALYARTGAFLQEVVKPQLELGKAVLIVGHGAMNCSIVCQVKNIPIKDFWRAGIENCKLMQLL